MADGKVIWDPDERWMAEVAKTMGSMPRIDPVPPEVVQGAVAAILPDFRVGISALIEEAYVRLGGDRQPKPDPETFWLPPVPTAEELVLAATLSAHELAAFGVDVPAGLGGDLCWRRRLGWAAAGVVRPAEQAGERCDGLEQQRVESGLLVGGALGVEAGGEPIPVGLGLGLVLVLGGLPAGLVARPPPAQRLGAGDGDGAMVPGLGGEGGVHGEWPGARPKTGGAGRVGRGMVSPG
jgi:hypothetical protein